MPMKSVGSEPDVPSLEGDSAKREKGYGRVREALLRVASSDSLCRFFCKGRHCKYCNPALLPDDLKTIDGFYSTWVTDDILAFARPSAVGTEMPELIEKLGKAGIKAIFNLQLPFEHRHCGQPLTEHGFSYDPEQFMEHGVAHYNFGWPDFGVISVDRILNIVKVMQHALEFGGKIILVTVEMLLELSGLKPEKHMNRYLTLKNCDSYMIDSRGNLLPLGCSAEDEGAVATTVGVNLGENPFHFNNVLNLMLSEEARLIADVEETKEALNKGNFDERWFNLIKDTNPIHYLALLGDWLLSLKSPLLDRNACAAIASADFTKGAIRISGDQVSQACLVTVSYICHAFGALSQQCGKAPINSACTLLARWFTQRQYEQEACDMAINVLQAFVDDSCRDRR